MLQGNLLFFWRFTSKYTNKLEIINGHQVVNNNSKYYNVSYHYCNVKNIHSRNIIFQDMIIIFTIYPTWPVGPPEG